MTATHNQDYYDKHDPSIQFNPPYTPTQADIDAGNKLEEIFSNPNLSDAQKSDEAYKVLNGN